MNRKSFVMTGAVLLFVGFLLFVLVVSNLPSGYWSPGLLNVRWYKINGLEMVNGNPQYVLDPPETGGGPTSAELTRIALNADPYFFEASPVGKHTPLGAYEKFYPVAQHFTQKYEGVLVATLVFEVTPNLSNSVYGYIGAFASVVIGLIFVMSGRSQTKQSTQQLSRNSVTPDKVSLHPKQVEGQDKMSKRTGDTPEQSLTPERKQVVHPSPENICSKCGYAGLPQDRFCRKCGNPLK